jgi:hypothetical protein
MRAARVTARSRYCGDRAKTPLAQPFPLLSLAGRKGLEAEYFGTSLPILRRARHSREAIRRRLHQKELKPWQRKMWCIAKVDGEYIAWMKDVLDLCAEQPDRNHPVVRLDESPQQLIGEVREPSTVRKPARSWPTLI